MEPASLASQCDIADRQGGMDPHATNWGGAEPFEGGITVWT